MAARQTGSMECGHAQSRRIFQQRPTDFPKLSEMRRKNGVPVGQSDLPKRGLWIYVQERWRPPELGMRGLLWPETGWKCIAAQL